MSSRCKACDRKLTDLELTSKLFNPVTKKMDYTELCFHCSGQEEDYKPSFVYKEDDD